LLGLPGFDHDVIQVHLDVATDLSMRTLLHAPLINGTDVLNQINHHSFATFIPVNIFRCMFQTFFYRQVEHDLERLDDNTTPITNEVHVRPLDVPNYCNTLILIINVHAYDSDRVIDPSTKFSILYQIWRKMKHCFYHKGTTSPYSQTTEERACTCTNQCYGDILSRFL
jgi:hypothetical protein